MERGKKKSPVRYDANEGSKQYNEPQTMRPKMTMNLNSETIMNLNSETII